MNPGDYDSAVIDFLAQQENARFTFEVEKYLEKVRDKLQLKFWHTLEKKVKEGIKQPKGWECRLSTDEEFLQKDKYGSLALWRSEDTAFRHLYQGINQDTSYCLEYGIVWSKQTKEPPQIGEIGILREALKEAEFETERSADWWLGIKRPGWCLRERNWCVRIAEGDTLEEEMATSFVELFERMRTMLEKANQALANTNIRRR